MDGIFEILRSSTDNAVRNEAAAQLRTLQEREPEAFLKHTYDIIASQRRKAEARFFLCTVVLNFVSESWRSAVPREMQDRYIGLYVSLLLNGSESHVMLTRKVSQVVAVMARRSSRVQEIGSLPPSIEQVLSSYLTELTSATAAHAYPRATYILMYLHILLKELQSIHVGGVFENACRKCVTPLSCVFASALDVSCILDTYDMFLYLFKCTLRVFGCTVLSPELAGFFLQVAWQLAAGLGHDGDDAPLADQRLRLLEYVVKILEAMVKSFPTQMSEVGKPFFVASAASAEDRCLFAFLSSVIRSPVATVVSEKLVCRAMRTMTLLLSAEDGDEFIADCLRSVSETAYFAELLRHLIVAYLADAVTPEALSEWSTAPEKVAAELALDFDDETSMFSCAEQLFLGFTGSTGCADRSLATVWPVVNEFLRDGHIDHATAALHAIGIGYYTMALGDSSDYLSFLRGELLPLLQPEAIEHTSPFVVRRVVWLVGMWCDSVTHTGDRRAVLTALELVLNKSVADHNLVLSLVTLQSIESFLTGDSFVQSDLPPNVGNSVLSAVRYLLKRVLDPPTIGKLANVVLVHMNKGALEAGSGTLLNLFLSTTLSLMAALDREATAAAEPGAASDSNDASHEICVDKWGALGKLLTCLAECAAHGSSDDVLWLMLPNIVMPCIEPGRPAAAWVEEEAWELLLAIVRGSHSFYAPAAAESLNMTLQHTSRDFSALPVVIRVLYSLLLLRQRPPEDVITAVQLEAWTRMLHESPIAELRESVAALLLVVARTSTGPLRTLLCTHATRSLIECTDVQAERYTIALALLCAVSVACTPTQEEQLQLLSTVQAAAQPSAQTDGPAALLEQLVLLLDVSPNLLVSHAIVKFIEGVSRTTTVSLSVDTLAMVQRAADGVLEDCNGAVAKETTATEMLFDVLQDDDVATSMPHYARVVATFSSVLLP